MMRAISRAIIIIVSLTFLFSFSTCFAGPVPDTGQTKCYDGVQEIPCPLPGEPFYGQDANYTTNPHSYTKLDAKGNDLPDSASSWVMVRDNVTGLIWENKTDDGSIHDKDNVYSWGNAPDAFIAKLNVRRFGGFHDWRLPTIKELSTLVDSSICSPSIDLLYFSNTQSSRYWSSTIAPFGWYVWNQYAWNIIFDCGSMGFTYTSENYYVRAVRDGQSGSFDNTFIDNGDGTITDTNSGLMWEQSGLTAASWTGALSYCDSLNLGGHNDWRLPDRNELQSLVDATQGYLVIDTTFFPDTQDSRYWSSTTVGTPSIAWYVNFVEDGQVSYGYKSDNFYVRAVRSVSTTSTTISSTTTTTITSGPCVVEAIYNEQSEQTELLRMYRDNVLSKTPEGQEIIKT
jgi:hypothetical protein